MAYVFDTQDAASFQFKKNPVTGTLRNLSWNGINPQVQDAQVIVNGLQRMLWITNQVLEYDPEDGTRTVKQNVINDA